MRIHIDYLKNQNQFIPEIAQAFFKEWNHLAPGMVVADVENALFQRTNTDKIPLVMVAFTKKGEWVGTAQLNEHDMDERPDFSPWFAGFYVKEEFRRQGTGQMLMSAILAKAKDLGIPSLYLYTEKAEAYYAKRNWVLLEKIKRGDLLLSLMQFSKSSFGVIMHSVFPAIGFHMDGLKFLDANGNEFIMRGVNFPYAWYTKEWARSVPAMKVIGCNTVRVVLGTGDQHPRTSSAELATIIHDLEAHQMLAVLEVHDCTGYGEQQHAPRAVPLTSATAYWTSPEIMAVLKGHEKSTIINIANEPIGNAMVDTWFDSTKQAVLALRAAGLTHTIMVDGPNWGQDFTGTMRAYAAELLAADPEKNLIFSVHIYESFKDRASIEAYLRAFVEAKLPLIVGEFATENNGIPVDAKSVLELCAQLGVGCLGWSWKGNSPGFTNLDIAQDWEGTRWTPWGELLVESEFGIRNNHLRFMK